MMSVVICRNEALLLRLNPTWWITESCLPGGMRQARFSQTLVWVFGAIWLQAANLCDHLRTIAMNHSLIYNGTCVLYFGYRQLSSLTGVLNSNQLVHAHLKVGNFVWVKTDKGKFSCMLSWSVCVILLTLVIDIHVSVGILNTSY